MFAFNVLSLLLSIFDLKRKKKKKHTKLNHFLNLFSFSVFFFFYVFCFLTFNKPSPNFMSHQNRSGLLEKFVFFIKSTPS